MAALALAVGLFFLVPFALSMELAKGWLGDLSVLFWLVEGVLRTPIFLGGITLLSRQRDLRRLFQYHGAEHKVISTCEAGLPLTVENAQPFSRLHLRCGTSFRLVVMIVATSVFPPVGLPEWYFLLVSRLIGVPLVTGLSFEVIKFAGRHRGKAWVQLIIWPGMQLHKLTMRQPDDDQVEVAIVALEAVLAVEDPRSASEADRVGVEVAAVGVSFRARYRVPGRADRSALRRSAGAAVGSRGDLGSAALRRRRPHLQPARARREAGRGVAARDLRRRGRPGAPGRR